MSSGVPYGLHSIQGHLLIGCLLDNYLAAAVGAVGWGAPYMPPSPMWVYKPNTGPCPLTLADLAVLCGAIIGAGLGFLWFNAPPAAIFMGDTGSLALGGMIGATAVATKHEIVLVIIGGLFVVEALSVIIQVASFKLTGKRVFRMAPIHHHFEKKGWTESQVVIRFWIISVMLAMIGLATLKLR